jgi:hypothetical protein
LRCQNNGKIWRFAYLQWQSKLAHSVSPQVHALLPAIPISFALHLQSSLKPQLVAWHLTLISLLGLPTTAFIMLPVRSRKLSQQVSFGFAASRPPMVMSPLEQRWLSLYMQLLAEHFNCVILNLLSYRRTLW